MTILYVLALLVSLFNDMVTGHAVVIGAMFIELFVLTFAKSYMVGLLGVMLNSGLFFIGFESCL